MRKEILFKFKLIVVFLVSVAIISLVTSNFVTAYGSQVSMRNVINVYNKPVTTGITIINNSNYQEIYNLKLHTNPFVGSLSKSNIVVPAGALKDINLTINPISNSLDLRYNVSLELINQSNKSEFTNFVIVQHKNKVCNLDVNYTIDYNKSSDLYRLNIFIINKSTKKESIFLNSLFDANSESIIKKALDVNSDSNILENYLIDTNRPTINLKYMCNNMEFIKEIKVPEKPVIKKQPKFSGYLIFSSISLQKLINSIIFQIILVAILIVLVLLFATRYLKLINEKK